MALHLAISHGLHTNNDTSYRTENIRRNRLWWSVYMQDRRLCAAGGYPMSIEDHAISAREPFDAPAYPSATALAVNTQTARVTGRITSSESAVLNFTLTMLSAGQRSTHAKIPKNTSLLVMCRVSCVLYMTSKLTCRRSTRCILNHHGLLWRVDHSQKPLWFPHVLVQVSIFLSSL